MHIVEKDVIKVKSLLAYASTDIQVEYNSFIKDASIFDVNQSFKQFCFITNQNKVLKNITAKLLSKEDFKKEFDSLNIRHGKIMNKLNIELSTNIASFKKLDM